MLRKALHEENRVAWNAATDAHNSHKVDQAAFFRNGGNTLRPEELDLLGEIKGKKLVHLQCNSGQDSLSLARLGAEVTGVDISDTAIAFAQQLSADCGIPAVFERADVFDWLAQTGSSETRFDVAFSSYGAVVWLSDIYAWAKGIAGVLKPGGRFVVVDFHPYAMIMDWDWKFTTSYFDGSKGVTWEEGIGDYVAMSGPVLAPSGYVEGVKGFKNPHRSHEFNWNISDLLTAFLQAGLTLTAFREYPYMNGAKLFNDMQEIEGKRMIPPAHIPALPLMYGIQVQK